MVFKYPPINYFMNIWVPNIAMAGLIFWAVTGTYEDGLTSLFKLILTVVPIVLFFSVFGLNNPSKVEMTEKHIIFSSYGRSHYFKWSEINSIKLKQYNHIATLFIRIGDTSFFRGRYWISTNLDGYLELRNTLYEKSFQLYEAQDSATAKRLGEEQ